MVPLLCAYELSGQYSRWPCLQLGLQGTRDTILRLEGGQLFRQDPGFHRYICLFYAIFTQNEVELVDRIAAVVSCSQIQSFSSSSCQESRFWSLPSSACVGTRARDIEILPPRAIQSDRYQDNSPITSLFYYQAPCLPPHHQTRPIVAVSWCSTQTPAAPLGKKFWFDQSRLYSAMAWKPSPNLYT
jgi:hypothetical protein